MKTKSKVLVVLAAVQFLWSASDALAFYNPSSGKWLSRDPIGEVGGENLSRVVENDLINGVDFLGLYDVYGRLGVGFVITGNNLGVGHNFQPAIEFGIAPAMQVVNYTHRGNGPPVPDSAGMIYSRGSGGYYSQAVVETGWRYFYVTQSGASPDTRSRWIDLSSHEFEQRQRVQALMLSAEALSYLEGAGAIRGIFWREIKAGSLACGRNIAAKTATTGRTIGLGLDLEGDLASARAAGGLTYENGAWQRAGLTTVDWGRASVDNSWFRMSFREAAQNADAIHFNVSNFSPAYPKPGMTTFEFNHIVNTLGLLPKTTFIQNGQTVIWNGTQFVRP